MVAHIIRRYISIKLIIRELMFVYTNRNSVLGYGLMCLIILRGYDLQHVTLDIIAHQSPAGAKLYLT